MNDLKPVVKYVHEQLFDAEIVLVISGWPDFLEEAKKIIQEGENFENLKTMVEKHGYKSSCLATQFPFNGGGSIIWANPEVTPDTLVHEMVHVAHHLLKVRAIPLSEDTEEVYAYLIQFLYNNLVKTHE